MALPAGLSVLPSAVRLHFDAQGNPAALHIDYHLLTASGAIGGGTRSLTPDGPTAVDAWQGDGTTVAFTTRQAPYPGGLFAVRVGGTPQASGWSQAANANGTVTVTFATAPLGASAGPPATAAQRVEVAYSTGPGIHGAGGDIIAALGLSEGSGAVYSGGGVTTASGKVADLATTLLAWAKARVEADA